MECINILQIGKLEGKKNPYSGEFIKMKAALKILWSRSGQILSEIVLVLIMICFGGKAVGQRTRFLINTC